jgi:sulfate/thiosulfate transport system permease protein
VVRELVPHLMEVGIKQEQAAYTLGASPWITFWLVTFPEIKNSLLYGMILTIARSLGEFGAVLIVSGSVIMVTESSTLYVYQEAANNDMAGAYAVSFVLALASFLILLILQLAKREHRGHRR